MNITILFNRCINLLFIIPFTGSCSIQDSIKGHWEKIESPLAASIISFAEGKEKNYYVGTSAGVYLSADRGATWKKTGLEDKSLNDIIVTDKGTLLAGTYRAGIFRSINVGITWTPVGFEKNGYQYRLIKDEKNTIFAAVSAVPDENDRAKNPPGIYKSTDDGLTWQPTGLSENMVYDISIPKPGLLFASHSKGLSYSKDQGLTWTLFGKGLPDSIPVSAIVNHNNVLFASVGNRQEGMGYSGGGIFCSKDGGMTWTRTQRGIDIKTKVNNIFSYGNLLMASTGNYENSGNQGVYKSIDGGANWVFAGVEEIVRFVKATATGELIACTDGASMFVSKNEGKDWTQTGKEIDNWWTYNIYERGNKIFVYDESGRIWKKEVKKENWKVIGKGNFSILSSGRILTFINNQVLASDNEGETWIKMAHMLPDRGSIRCLTDSLIVALTKQGLYYSTDDGAIWKRYNTVGYYEAQFKAATITSEGTIFASYIIPGKEVGVLCSKDGGRNWKIVTKDFLAWTLYYHNGTLLAGSYALGIFRSTDNGVTWRETNSGLRSDDEYVTVTCITSTNDSTLYLGTMNKGIYKSTNYGKSWKNDNDGLANLSVWDVNSKSKGLLRTTTAQGIFSKKQD